MFGTKTSSQHHAVDISTLWIQCYNYIMIILKVFVNQMDGRWSSLLSFVLSLFLSENKRKYKWLLARLTFRSTTANQHGVKDFISQSEVEAKTCTGGKRGKTCNLCKAKETVRPAKCAGNSSKARENTEEPNNGWPSVWFRWLNRSLIAHIIYKQCIEQKTRSSFLLR